MVLCSMLNSCPQQKPRGAHTCHEASRALTSCLLPSIKEGPLPRVASYPTLTRYSEQRILCSLSRTSPAITSYRRASGNSISSLPTLQRL